MTTIFYDVGIVLVLASLFAILAHFVKQPLLVGYILAGVIASFFGLFHEAGSRSILDLLATFGTTFLLFLIGMELRFSDIRIYGPIALLTGVVQIVVTAVLGFFLLKVLQFSTITSLYIALALTFSSTVVAVKMLTDRRDLDSLYGKLTVGFLLAQDAVAIGALILVTAFGSGSFSATGLFGLVLRSVILLASIVVISRTVLPWLFDRAGHSLEILSLLSVSWAVLVATFASSLGLSIEIGAFLAGLALANLPQEHQIASRVRSLRDLFIVFFFVLLGVGLTLSGLVVLIIPIVILSAFILIVKPLIVLFILGMLGFRKRTAFMAAIAIAQVSEFSLILLKVAKDLGKTSQADLEVLTAVTLITIIGSSYLIMHSTQLYKKLGKYLDIFEKKNKIEQVMQEEKTYENHVVLIGAGRLGWEILKQLKKLDYEEVVIEFNPNIAGVLKEKNYNFLFGDITDPDIFESASVEKASLIISTVFDQDDTNELLTNIKNLEKKPLIFVTAPDQESAMRFYKKGADYVIIPRVLSGHQIANFLTKEKLESFRSGDMREKHLEELRETINQFS